MRTPLQRLCLIAAASSGYTFVVNGGMFWGNQLGDLVAGYSPAYFATLWVANDARSTRYWPAYHYGLFVFLLWFIALPHYVLKTRGPSGWALAAGLILLAAAPALAGVAGWWFYEDLLNFRE